MARAQARPTRPIGTVVVLLVLGLASPACRKAEVGQGAAPGDAASEDAAVISALVTAEETYLTLSPKMSALSKGLLNLRLPGPGAEAVFAPSVSVRDIGPAPERTAIDAPMI